MPSIRRFTSAMVAAAVLALAMQSAPTSAGSGDPTLGPHSGNVGAHMLIDTGKYPGATCTYGAANHLRSITVRPPIVYAFNRTAGTDTQWVAWRVILESVPPDATAGSYVDWPDVTKGPWTRVEASDLHNARWSRSTVQLPAGSDRSMIYRTSVEIRWFHPGRSHRDGRAIHVVAKYRQKDPGGSAIEDSCPGTVATSTADDDAGHSGRFGVHALFDSQEFPGATCTYRNTPTDDTLKRISIRPPIVYAVDRSNGTDTQSVGWRYSVEVADVGPPSESDWSVVYTSPIVKVKATDAYNAQWTTRRLAIPDSDDHGFWRVLVEMYWFRANGSTVSGKASQVDTYYLSHYGTSTGIGALDCGGTAG